MKYPIKVVVPDDKWEVIYSAWRNDVDEEGYDYPFLDFWARRRWNAKVFGNNLEWYFSDDVDAVEFKLKFL